MHTINSETALRLAGAFAVDRLNAAKQDFDFLDGLILMSTVQANLDLLYRDPALRQQYAAAADCPADDLRRPISINALAQSMGLPFETVRRRVVGLSCQGMLATAKQGVYVPAATCSGPRHTAVLNEKSESLRRLHDGLLRAGWTPQARAFTQPNGAPPARLMARISTEFCLRLIRSLTTLVGDPVAVALWLALLSGDGSGRLNRPIRVSNLARRLGMSHETTRRRIQTLAGRGLCQIIDGGACITQAELETPEFAKLAQYTVSDLRRMFAQLTDIGVVDAWRFARTGETATTYARAA